MATQISELEDTHLEVFDQTSEVSRQTWDAWRQRQTREFVVKNPLDLLFYWRYVASVLFINAL